MPEQLDAIDWKILGVLQRDASKSTTEVADEVGLSQAPCWRRIQRLKAAGYIRAQVCLLDRHKLNLNTQIFAQVKLNAHAHANLTEISETMQNFPEVLDCFLLLGSMDFMLRIVTQDIDSYERFFFDKLSQIPGVREVNSMVTLSAIKSTTELPIAQQAQAR